MVSDSHRPLRIGIVTEGLEERGAPGQVQIANGGVGVYIYNLVKHLRLIDPVNEYYLIRHGHGDLDIYGAAGDHSVILPSSVLTRFVRMLDLSYRRIANDLELDLVHYPNQFGGAFLPRSIRRVVTLHDITPLLFPRYHPWSRVLGYRLLLSPSLRAADHVIVDSASTRADLTARRLVADSKITVIPLAAAATFHSAACTEGFLQRYELPARFIFTVGVLEPRKNHAVLVKALARLHAQGQRVGLVIVGRDGWRWNDPLRDPAFAHLASWVRIFRNVPDADLVELYKRAEVFAYPSFYEGFGLPVVEAMACGTPVVTTAVSSLPEVAGAAALFADPTNLEDFTAKLLAILSDPALRSRLVSAGKRRANEFSWQRTAQATLRVYERVVCGR